MNEKKILDRVTIRFVGDSGDGIQLIGNQIADISVVYSNNDIYSFVEFPPEIRAPLGTISGISGFQLSISKEKIFSIEDKVDLLVVMNPAAFKNSISCLKNNGILILDLDTFNERNYLKANLIMDPLLDDSLKKYRTLKVPITTLTYNAVKSFVDSVSKTKKSRNMFVLGLISWIYDRNIDGLLLFLKKKFCESDIFFINKDALLAGYNYGDNLEIFHEQYYIPPYKENNINLRRISGNKAFSLGIVASSVIGNIEVFSAGYPITPSSDILQELINCKVKNIITLQLEDEIAAVSASIGASYGGNLSVTFTSGPGLDLMSEGVGLAIMSELPLVLIDIQRVGPSTGIPTKSEQTDLFASIFGRHGESPVIVLAPNSPKDCFWIIIEAFYLSVKYLLPVIILSDANLANSSELWNVPSSEDIYNTKYGDLSKFISLFNENRLSSYLKSDAIKPTIGGLERNRETGCVSYEPDNHFRMTKFRFNKLNSVVEDIDLVSVVGNFSGSLLVITWGSVFGVLKDIHKDLSFNGFDFSLISLRHLNPFPKNFLDIIRNYKKIMVVEENMGQLSYLLKSNFLLNVLEVTQVTGKPFFSDYLRNLILYNI